jgi:hypothetical protein
MKPIEVIFDIRVILEAPLPGVMYALQEGSGRNYKTLQKQESFGSDLHFQTQVRALSSGKQVPQFRGAVIQGPPLERFIYLDIGTAAGQLDSEWSRRLKIPLRGIDPEWIQLIQQDPTRLLEARVPGVAANGTPTCGTIKPFSGWRLVKP